MRRRGPNFTKADRDVIRLLLSKGHSVRAIAAVLDRGKSGVHTQIERMKASGEIDQTVMDLGQADEQQ